MDPQKENEMADEEQGLATASPDATTVDSTDEQRIEELISDSIKETDTSSPDQDQTSVVTAPETDEPKSQDEESTPQNESEPSKAADATTEDDPIYTPPIKLDEMPPELRAVYEELDKGYKAGYTKKTQALAEERTRLGKLTEYEGRVDEIAGALAFQQQVNKMRNDPNAMNALMARMRGGTPSQPGALAEGPSPDATLPNPADGIRQELKEAGYSEKDLQNLERLSDAKMEQYHQQIIQPMLTQRQTDQQDREIDQQNREVADLNAQVAALESDTEKYPYFPRLRQMVFDRWQNDSENVKTLADAYNILVKEANLGGIESDAKIHAAANLVRKKNASSVESSGTGTGTTQKPDPDTVEEMIGDAVTELG